MPESLTMSIRAMQVRELREQSRRASRASATVREVARNSGLLWELTLPGCARCRQGARRRVAEPVADLSRIHAPTRPTSPRSSGATVASPSASSTSGIESRRASGFSARGFGRKHERRHHDAEPARVPRGRRGAARMGRRGGQRLVAIDRRGARVPREALRGARPSSSRPTSGTSSSRRRRAPRHRRRQLHRRRRRACRAATPLRRTPRRASGRVRTVEGGGRTTRRSSSTPRARPASRRAPSASSRRTRCPPRMQFIAETPMRVDDVHLVTCPLYHSTAFGFLSPSRAPRRHRRCSWTSSSPSSSSSSSSATA